MRLQQALAVLGFVSLVAQVATAAEGVKLVVVPAQARGGPNVKAQILSLVEKPLGSSTTIIPFANYQRAAKAAGVRARSITGPEAVVPAGRGAGATHVLILESQSDKTSKKRKGGAINASLIDVSTGETLLSRRFPFAGKKLTSDVASQIVRDVNQSLQKALAPPTPAIEAPPPPPAPTGPVAPLPPSTLPSAEAAPPPAPAGPGAPVPPPADQPVTPEAAATAEGGAASAKSMKVRPGVRVSFGAMLYERRATVNAGAGTTPPCYCEPAGVGAPLFSRMILRAELYPIALAINEGHWYEGFGVYVDGSLGFPRTNLGSGTVATSTSGSFAGGGAFRFVLWDSPIATDLTAKFGYWTYSFPLAGAVFPGLGFRSPYAGLDAHIPLGIPELALQLGGMYGFWEITFGGANNFGTQTTATGPGKGLHLEGGLRATLFNALDITAVVFYENFKASYQGHTNFALTTMQYSNVSVSDTLMGGFLMAGFAL